MWVALLALVVVPAVADELTPLRCRDARCRYIGRYQFDEHRYQVDGSELWVMYGNFGEYLRIRCKNGSILDSPAMPRADPALRVWDMHVANCQLPSAGSLADKLAELNITMQFNDTDAKPRGNLTIESFSTLSLINTQFFAGLEGLVSLHLYSEEDAIVSAERHFLDPLKSIRSLTMQHVTLPAGELDAPRPSLRELTLRNTGIERLPEAIYSSPSLLTLTIESDNALDAVAVPPELRRLDLQSPATTLRLDAMPALEKLAITHWTEPQAPPLTRCDNLRKLHLTVPAVHTLPYGWLANCSSLEELVVQSARNLTTLPQRMFGSCVFSLDLIAFKDGVLEELSEGQFDNATCVLSTLELDGNRLQMIPNNTLPSSLEELDLSSNNLDGRVLDVVKMVHFRLHGLNLANNPRLGDVCDEKGYSPLRQVTSLKRLLLNKTNVTRICQDWRMDLSHLEMLDLSHTNVTSLSFEDIQFKRTVKSKLLLLGASVTSLEMTRDNFQKAKRTPTSLTSVRINSELQCDCRMYWTRQVLDRSPYVLDHISELRCTGGRLLHEVASEDMVCVRPQVCAAAALPAACECAVRPDEDPDQSRQLVRVRCEHAKLLRVPRLPASKERYYELLLAHNTITEIHSYELHHIKGLDLRHNIIRQVGEATAAKLGRLRGLLRLAGNPLECDCSAAPLLQALHSRALGYTDIGNATCSDGTALDAAFVVGCPPSVAWLAGGLAALFALAVAILAYLGSRERRFFAKAVLHRWGLWRAETDDEDLRYDAFVTFSHKDEAMVRELVARLEPPYRLCLHYRDWIPGLLIPDQIVQSVQESRRTVALVSRHFLASTWTRAEFREAHAAAMLDARPRLIVVLLEEPAALPLDDQLQRYVATHTYLRWGDPWFWNKLAVALPRPRQPAAVINFAASSTSCTFSAPVSPVLPPLTKFEEKRLPSDVRLSTSGDEGSSSALFTLSKPTMDLVPGGGGASGGSDTERGGV